jgi:DNA-nicking Smr family endonuclease
MSSKPPSRKRALTAEEAGLWAAAMRDAKQHRRRAMRDHEPSTEKKPPGLPSAPAANLPAKSPSLTPPAPQPKPLSVPPPIDTFDHRHKRKLSRNIETIDSRIDLHGMRQSEAYPALRRFLFACAARGDRNVLVITGKGTRAEMERMRDFTAEERGVLRRLVPQWLGEPELRGIVISYTTAGPRHGGDGALYVRIRKLNRE